MKKTIVLQVFDWDKITKADGIGEVTSEREIFSSDCLLLTPCRSKFLSGK